MFCDENVKYVRTLNHSGSFLQQLSGLLLWMFLPVVLFPVRMIPHCFRGPGSGEAHP